MGTSRRQKEIEERISVWPKLNAGRKLKNWPKGNIISPAITYTREAMKLNLWLYDPKFKCWHEPEVFYRKYHTVPKSDPVFTRVQLKDPMDGLKSGHEMLQDLSNRLMILQNPSKSIMHQSQTPWNERRLLNFAARPVRFPI